MASSLIPSTPRGQSSQAPPVSTPPTGTWQHPRFDEIARRQSQGAFSDANIKKIIWNAGFLLSTWLVGNFTTSYPYAYHIISPLVLHSEYPVVILRLLLVFNIAVALLPLIRRKDDLSDIPLMPSQRALLGLDPNATLPTTPGTQYFTPPRYQRSSTPRSGTPGSRSSGYSNSPLSGKGSPSLGRAMGGSPFSPSPSPLLQKAFGGGVRDSNRRHSYGSPSPLEAGASGKDMSIIGAPSTPSPSTNKGASVGLNSRWLYERGRGSPVNRSIYS